jgi:hypothetical protein
MLRTESLACGGPPFEPPLNHHSELVAYANPNRKACQFRVVGQFDFARLSDLASLRESCSLAPEISRKGAKPQRKTAKLRHYPIPVDAAPFSSYNAAEKSLRYNERSNDSLESLPTDKPDPRN